MATSYCLVALLVAMLAVWVSSLLRAMPPPFDDLVAVDDGGQRRVLRVVKLSGQKITLADHFEAGALKSRDADKEDPFKYLEKSANVLKSMGLRKVGIDEIGRLTDPGPQQAKSGGKAA